jgi:heme-degrading monooxygenase HmoA
MKSRWKQVAPIDPGQTYIAFASRIPPKSVKSTWRLFKGSRAVAAQLAKTNGVIGFSLLARPFRKEYATISLWLDDAALAEFARSHAHARLQDELTAEMAETTFVRWTVQGRNPAPSWSETIARLDQPRAPADEAL